MALCYTLSFFKGLIYSWGDVLRLDIFFRQIRLFIGNERVPKLRFAIGCGYVLCGCGSVRLPTSKSRLRLAQIGGYLVGYRLLRYFL